MDKYIYGADTETYFGLPMSLQFYSEDVACDEIYFVGPKSAADTFFKWCAKRKRNVQHVVYIHNLSFDLPELLWGHHSKLIGPGGDFDFKVGKWHVRGVYGTPTFARISNDHDISIILVDSFSYFRGSLAKGAELFCPDLPKLKRVSGIGSTKFTSRDSDFVAYAMRDAVIAYHMGRAIEKLHQEFDLQQCVSVADMSARVFRHRFLDYTIPQPSREIIDASLLSYHGGKNNVTEPAGWYENVSSIDISSAYPDAMRNMPAFSNERLYRRYRSTGRALSVKEVPDYGVYAISGSVADCKWPCVFSHGFKSLSGNIDRVWVQGFEVNEAIRSGEFKPSTIRGYYYDEEKDIQAPALRNFVEAFYEKKANEKDKVLKFMYKLILNAISGKFIQTRKRGSTSYTDVDAGTTVVASELIAGGMCHPFIGSAIPAHTRARIHRLEHKYKAIHTATDGILSQNGFSEPKRSGLGSLSLEAKSATLLLVRNKCYVLYGKRSAETTSSRVFRGKHIIKYALHGFQGDVSTLERLIASGRRKYTVNRPNRLKESLKRGLTPNDFVKREYTLKVGPLTVRKSARHAR